MKSVAILIPVYQDDLSAIEAYSVGQSLRALAGRDVFFIGPQTVDTHAYTQRFGSYPFIHFDNGAFASIQAYNRLLLSADFYARFADYDTILILQTDAIVFRDELDFWCAGPFDYVGAPWPDAYELRVNLGPFAGELGKQVRTHVGNGGLSLRRVRKCLALLEEFPDAIAVFNRTGSSEDLFFSVMGALSHDFVIPNEITASTFAMELKPSYYYAVNGGRLPMGAHAWARYEPDFWRSHFADMPALTTA